ncbi:hypothetical protein ACHHYP_07914 [Achlya hypogyna]|uniref:Uncharacterized protein n=1 Tax=Achlya hypogyna TaxID=1202772 RepID=A0A1V9YQ83_ACHHY|nr:hypothetical protein ACHHYP_07914 [Achlya hypogyna]
MEFVEDSQSEDELRDAPVLGSTAATSSTATTAATAAAAPVTATTGPPSEADGEDADGDEYKVGDLVEVETRTWPGINKIGGAARVTRVYSEGGDTYVDVRYFLGGSEKRVDIDYVAPSDMHQKRARQRYSRVFFHDEFADEYARKRKVELELAALSAPKPKRPRKVKPHQSLESTISTAPRPIVVDEDSSDNADYIVPASTSLRKTRPNADRIPLQEDFFIIRDDEADADDASTGEDEDADAYVDIIMPELDVESPVATPASPQASLPALSTSVSATRDPTGDMTRHRHRKQRKKRRYVGGYLEEADNFIQPEDNAMDLPDDVRKDTGFRLGKTSKDLLHQYALHAEQFQLVLADFEKTKSAFNASSLEPLALYDKVVELESIHALSIVREEDILDAILRKLEAKGKSISPIENLQHDQRKEQVNVFANWLKQLRDTTLQRLHQRGLAVPAPAAPTAADQSESSSSDDDYREPAIPSFIEQFHVDQPTRPRASVSTVSRTRRPKQTMAAVGRNRNLSQQPRQPSLVWDDVYHSPPRREQTALPWFFGDGRDDDSDDDGPLEPPVFAPRTFNSRTIPAAVLESTQWDWKALAKPLRRKASRVTPQPPSALPAATSAPKKPTKSRSKNIFEALWRHRQERYRPAVPFFPQKKKPSQVRHQQLQPEKIALTPSLPDAPVADNCVLDYVSETLPALVAFTTDDLVRINSAFSFAEILPEPIHEDAPLERTVMRSFQTLRHLVCDLQIAESAWLEKKTQSHLASDEETLQDELDVKDQLQACCRVLASLDEFLGRQDDRDKANTHAVLTSQIQRTLQLLPRIKTLLEATPAYYFYLELTGAVSTPLLDAVTTVFAYCVCWLPDKATQQVAAIFLLDMHLHVPDLVGPARGLYSALWLRLIRYQGEEFWAFLQALLPVVRKAVVVPTFPSEPPVAVDMLLRELLWDVVVALAPLFVHAVPAAETLHHWALTGYLLSSMETLPCSPRYDNVKFPYPLDKIERYRQRVLQRLLLLSSIWEPNHLAIVAVVLSLTQLSSSHPGQCACAASAAHGCDGARDCPCLTKHVVCGCAQPFYCSCRFPRFLIDLATTGAVDLTAALDQCSSLDLLGRVIAMQLRRLAKPVQRNRFRHPILTVLKPVAVAPTAKWNWAGVTTGKAPTVKPPPTAPTTAMAPLRLQAKPVAAWLDDRASARACWWLTQFTADAQTQCTVFLSMALSSVAFQPDPKSLRRDVSHYAKEILRFCDGELEYDGLAVHALWLLARGLLSVAGQCLPALFTALNDLLAAMIKRLPELAGRPLPAADARVIAPVTVLHADIAFALQCLLDLVQTVKRLEIPVAAADDIAASLTAVYSTGLEAVLQACQQHQLPEGHLRLALQVIHTVLPPATAVPPPSSADEFDDPEEMALLAALDMDALLPPAAITVPVVSFHALVVQRVADPVAKGLRAVLQKLVLLAPQSALVLGALGGIFALAPTTSWELLLAATASPSLRFVPPRVLREAVARATDAPAFVAAWAQTHRRDALPLELWLLAMLDPRSDDAGRRDITHALATHTPLLRTVPPTAPWPELWAAFATNVRAAFEPLPTLFRSGVADGQKGWLTAVLDGATAALLEVAVERPQWGVLQALQASHAPFGATDVRLLARLAAGTSATHRAVRFVGRLYECVAALLAACGDLARGAHLVFHGWQRELFPSASYAAHSAAAQSLLHGQVASVFREKPGPPTIWFASKLAKPWVQVVDVARAFFAVQHYPTLLQWFAQTAEVYRLYEGGFQTAPLRTLLYNLVDVEGSLGLASFYPMDSDASPTWAREADYFARGLAAQDARFRRLVLDEFVLELVTRRLHLVVGSEDWVPLLQLLWACGYHSASAAAGDFAVSLQLCTQYLVAHLDWPKAHLTSPLTSVLHRELIGFAHGCLALCGTDAPSTVVRCLQLITLRCLYMRSALQTPPQPPTAPVAAAFDRIKHLLTVEHGVVFASAPPIVLPSDAGSVINGFRAQGDLLVSLEAFLAAVKSSQNLDLAAVAVL